MIIPHIPNSSKTSSQNNNTVNPTTSNNSNKKPSAPSTEDSEKPGQLKDEITPRKTRAARKSSLFFKISESEASSLLRRSQEAHGGHNPQHDSLERALSPINPPTDGNITQRQSEDFTGKSNATTADGTDPAHLQELLQQAQGLYLEGGGGPQGLQHMMHTLENDSRFNQVPLFEHFLVVGAPIEVIEIIYYSYIFHIYS